MAVTTSRPRAEGIGRNLDEQMTWRADRAGRQWLWVPQFLATVV
jgi:hypothetical protein